MFLLMMAMMFQRIMPESLPVLVSCFGSLAIFALVIIENELHLWGARKKIRSHVLTLSLPGAWEQIVNIEEEAEG